jgi:hypothetical protein
VRAILLSRSRRRTHRHWLAAALAGTLLTLLLPPGTASAATIDHVVTVDVTLDTAGTSTIAGFNPALGTLSQVAITIDVDVLVQACVENRQTDAGAPGTGSITGSLAVELPTGANTTQATADADLPGTDLTPANGTDDCTTGLDDTGTFLAPVTAPDVGFAQDAGDATRTETLTGTAIQPFIGTGPLTITHTPTNDTQIAVPAEWDAVSVAVGNYQVAVTYTYTPAAGAPTAAPGSPAPATGTRSSSSRTADTGAPIEWLVFAAAALVLAGATAVVIAKRQRSPGASQPPPST